MKFHSILVFDHISSHQLGFSFPFFLSELPHCCSIKSLNHSAVSSLVGLTKTTKNEKRFSVPDPVTELTSQWNPFLLRLILSDVTEKSLNLWKPSFLLLLKCIIVLVFILITSLFMHKYSSAKTRISCLTIYTHTQSLVLKLLYALLLGFVCFFLN